MKNNTRCPKAGSEICKKNKCTVYGTNKCIDAMPQSGNCNIRPCTRACALYGTDFCIGGVVREIKDSTL